MTKPFTIIDYEAGVPILCHIPHGSRYIPPEIKSQFSMNEKELQKELLLMTDAHTDELFSGFQRVGAAGLINNLSRLVLDPERFVDDSREMMSEKGMGVVYTRTSSGGKLRETLKDTDRCGMLRYYYCPYHEAFESEAANLLKRFGKCLIVDCHSFPSEPLPCEFDQDLNRPDICIGTDDFHTTEELSGSVPKYFKDNGLTVYLNKPFAGTIVPMKFYRSDARVSSIMIEINRRLYMDEKTGKKKDTFDDLKKVLGQLFEELRIIVMAESSSPR